MKPHLVDTALWNTAAEKNKDNYFPTASVLFSKYSFNGEF